MTAIQPKKKNLFKFFKSKDFNEARVKMCALYVLISYANELHEDVDRLLQGYEGVLIGMLKHKSKLASKALEDYSKEYEMHIDGGLGNLADTAVDAATAIEETIEQNSYHLSEGYKAIRRAIDEQMEHTIRDDEQLEKEQFAGFEIFDPESRRETMDATMRKVKQRFRDDPNLGKILQGVRIGFDTACDYVNEIYLKS